jgi:hypothetical protein
VSRKYRQQGYQDSDRDREQERPRQDPRRDLTREERIQKRSLRHAIDREANEVVRCHVCGRNVDAFGTIELDTSCPHCSAPLHCCRTCQHFDSGARHQCRADIEKPIGDKTKANRCGQYAARLVLDVTGRRSRSGGGRGSGDPRSQFENLFKR